MFVCFLFLLPVVLSDTCPTCPTGGIWSSWTTNETCATTCGGCSTVTRNRTCLSTDIGCACTGSTTSTIACNTQACNYPRVNANISNCCSGSLMLHNNIYHCGPLEADLAVSCCPTGGYWSTWSSYSKVTNQNGWSRTRTCLSANHGCACTGDTVEYSYTCPCPTVTQLATTSTLCSSMVPSGWVPADGTNFRPVFIARPSMCTGYVQLQASNFYGMYMTNDSNADSYLGYIQPNGTCYVDIVHPGILSISGALQRMTYTCNLETGYYQNTAGVDFVQFAQFYNPTASLSTS